MRDGALRLGVLEAARIALGGVMPAAARTDAVEVVAVASRSGKKAREVRAAAPTATLFEDYEAFLEEAVYFSRIPTYPTGEDRGGQEGGMFPSLSSNSKLQRQAYDARPPSLSHRRGPAPGHDPNLRQPHQL